MTEIHGSVERLAGQMRANSRQLNLLFGIISVAPEESEHGMQHNAQKETTALHFAISSVHSAYGRQQEQQKFRINRTLETNPVPSFWVSNQVKQINPAFLRRFALILKIGVPPRSVRRRSLDKYMGAFPMEESWLAQMTHQEELAYGLTKVMRPAGGKFIRQEA
ncbi:MAG: hypothetical protein HQL91_09990 [Magnetococcales bacterium]|nr:hypothetical protein [Magnetococcales bacterium]